MWIYIWENEIKDIFVWEWMDSYEAMRWPCPEGFHVPSNTEWTGVRTIMVWLGFSTGNSWATNLHLPLAKHIKQSDWTIDSSDTKGYYFASTPWTWTAMYRLYMTTSSVSSTGTGGRASWYSVRAFKDNFEVPNSNRTVITGTLWSAWIFWNQSDWLISITSDWTTGYTIMDKNIWATIVYNYWDTLSEANCWYFFQRWNNYWFPRTWPTTTSSTAIDTTGYWPWNYYNNGTFITITWDWSSPSNDNLRWWTTWMTKKWNVIEVYVGTTKIRPSTTPPTPPAEFTDWDDDVWDYVRQSFIETGDTEAAIEYMFGSDISFTIQDDLGTDLSDWEFSPIMPFYPDNTSWYGLQISNWWDMIDKHLVPDIPWYTQSICIIRDNDNLDDVEYIVWTYDSSDDWFDYQLSSLASNFSGKDTVLMFIFK